MMTHITLSAVTTTIFHHMCTAYRAFFFVSYTSYPKTVWTKTHKDASVEPSLCVFVLPFLPLFRARRIFSKRKRKLFCWLLHLTEQGGGTQTLGRDGIPLPIHPSTAPSLGRTEFLADINYYAVASAFCLFSKRTK